MITFLVLGHILHMVYEIATKMSLVDADFVDTVMLLVGIVVKSSH